MKYLRIALAVLLCFSILCLFSACGEDAPIISHTHVMAETYHPAPNCYSYGYTEQYCIYCTYSIKTYDTSVSNAHEFDEDHTYDKKETAATDGLKSRHCKWYEHCGQSIDPVVIPATGYWDIKPGPIN